MTLREQILRDAEAIGGDIDPEWVAYQMVRLCRQYEAQGIAPERALDKAKQEMADIAQEVVQKRGLRYHLEAWLIIIAGVLLCVGWYLLWA